MACRFVEQYLPTAERDDSPNNWSRTWHQPANLTAARLLYGGGPWSSLFYRVAFAQGLLTLAALYTFYFLKRAPAGQTRLLLSMPVFIILYAVPFLFSYVSEPFIMMCMCFVSFRMAVGKVSGACTSGMWPPELQLLAAAMDSAQGVHQHAAKSMSLLAYLIGKQTQHGFLSRCISRALAHALPLFSAAQVLALVLGRGALALDLSFPEFYSLMQAPIMPAELESGLPRQQPQPASVLNPQTDPSSLPSILPAASMPLGKQEPDGATGDALPAIAAPAGLLPKSSSSASCSDSSSNGSILEGEGRPSKASYNGSFSKGIGCSNNRGSSTGLVAMCNAALQDFTNSSSLVWKEDSSKHSSSKAHSSTATTRSSSSGGGVPTTIANIALNLLVIIAFCCYSFHSWQASLATGIRIGGLWFMWRAMDFIMNIAAGTCEFWWGLALAPQFYYPLGSTSLSDFWGRRWNLTQGLVLKHYVYQPIVEGRWVAAAAAAKPCAGKSSCAASPAAAAVASGDEGAGPFSPAANGLASPAADIVKASDTAAAAANPPAAGTATAARQLPGASPAAPAPQAAAAVVPPRWRRNTAVCLTFLVSGIEHEIYRWYMTNRISYEWLLFFTVQGPVMALEKPLKKWARGLGFELHPWVSPLAVLMVLGVMADLWFWPVVTDEVLLGHCKAALRADAVPLIRWMGC